MTRRLAAAGIAALSAAVLAPPAAAITGGAIDTRFADCGQATALVPSDIARRQFSYGAGASLAVQPDGKIVAAGPAARGMGASRFNPDGSLDRSFGGDGVAFIPASEGRFAETHVTSVGVQEDGKVVAAGWMRAEQGPGPSSELVQRIVIARFTPTGEPDTTFSGDGLVVEVPPGSTTATAYAMAPAPGGAVVVAGQVDERFAVTRFRDDGTLDPGFGEGGVARTATAGEASAISVLADGRIVAAGLERTTPGSNVWTVRRLMASGAPDTTFGGTGTVSENFDETAFVTALVPLADGGLYAVGTTADRWGTYDRGGITRRAAIVRYLENGARDTSFAGDGSVLDALGQGLHAIVTPTAAALDPQGRLAIATQYGSVVRYTPDGARDAAFGHQGILRVVGAPSGESLALLPDGALLLGGGNMRQGSRPRGFEWGPAIMRLAAGGAALEGARGQPAACAVRIRNTSMRHLLRTGRSARYGKVIVGAVLSQPSVGSGLVAARATAGGRSFELGHLSFARPDAGSTAFEVKMTKTAYRRLRGVRKARISVTITLADRDTAPASAARTLR